MLYFRLKSVVQSGMVTAGLLGLVGCASKQKKQFQLQIEENAFSKAFFDTKPIQEHVSYIYAPGMMGTEIMMGRYCPQFVAVTGEKITWRSGGHVIGFPHSAVIFPEVNLRKPGGFTLNPLKCIMNGLRKDLFPLAQRALQECYDFTLEDNPYSSKSVADYSFNFSQSNIAQRKDIKALHKAYHAHLQKYPGTQIVLYGDSRGAATIFNFIAEYKPTCVKAAVVEGIFDTVPHCIKHFLYSDKKENEEAKLHNVLAFVMGSYNKKGPFPRDYAEKITDDVPLLLVTSLKDGLVAPQCTLYLYNRLYERGHKKIHLLVLKNSLHPCYMINDADDRTMYEAVVHAFYKKYGLPYNGKKASEGEIHFLATQPTAAEVKVLYPLASCSHC